MGKDRIGSAVGKTLGWWPESKAVTITIPPSLDGRQKWQLWERSYWLPDRDGKPRVQMMAAGDYAHVAASLNALRPNFTLNADYWMVPS